jgi:hypothetical protein
VIQTSIQDIRFALRQFRKRPGFTLMAIMILALGLGANTAIFSVVNAFLLRPLPFKDPARLTALYERDVVGSEPYNEVAPANFLDWQKLSASFEQIAAYTIDQSICRVAVTALNRSGSTAVPAQATCFRYWAFSPYWAAAFAPTKTVMARLTSQ